MPGIARARQAYPSSCRVMRTRPRVRRRRTWKRRQEMRLRAIVLTVAWLLSALAAEAQISTGSIIGVVRDESRAVLPGVTVTITSPAMPGGPATAATNAQGEYR